MELSFGVDDGPEGGRALRLVSGPAARTAPFVVMVSTSRNACRRPWLGLRGERLRVEALPCKEDPIMGDFNKGQDTGGKPDFDKQQQQEQQGGKPDQGQDQGGEKPDQGGFGDKPQQQ